MLLVQCLAPCGTVGLCIFLPGIANAFPHLASCFYQWCIRWSSVHQHSLQGFSLRIDAIEAACMEEQDFAIPPLVRARLQVYLERMESLPAVHAIQDDACKSTCAA